MAEIISAIEIHGDKAVAEYSEKLDKIERIISVLLDKIERMISVLEETDSEG